MFEAYASAGPVDRAAGGRVADLMAEVEPIWREAPRGSFGDRRLLALDGLERMRESVRGGFPAPPIHHLTGLRLTEAGPGTSTFAMPASPWWQTPAGVFNAGVMAFAADAPLGSAVVTSLPPGKIIATSDLTLNYFRAVTPASGQLVARARLIHAGRLLGLSEATIEDGQGRLLGHATSRCFLLEPPGPIEQPTTEVPPAEEEPRTPDPYLRPVIGETLPQDVFDRLTGLEVLGALIRGELPAPPIHHFLGGRFEEVQDGTAIFVLPASGWLASPAGTVYGGALAWLADVCLSGTVQTTIPARTAFAPLDLKVSFLRPALPDGTDLVARGRLVHRGRSLAVVAVEITGVGGKPVAVASGSAVILPGRAWVLGGVGVEESAEGGDLEQDAGASS
jgi:uncharacterized protein (TIGR00369 family)